mmetsp:Transcript_8705/g.18552  ORF Transcript_8705/g.18552 Transcript_8705/m.18552 type:complete len:227 (+) Transcript_8705:68-748(+)
MAAPSRGLRGAPRSALAPRLQERADRQLRQLAVGEGGAAALFRACGRLGGRLDVDASVVALHGLARSEGRGAALEDPQLAALAAHLGMQLAGPLGAVLAPRPLVNTAWAMARLELGDAPLRDSIAASSLRPLSDFAPGDLAGLAWSFSRLSLPDPTLLDAIAAAARRNISLFGPAELAAMAWAFARRSFRHGPLREALSSAAIRSCSLFAVQDLSMTAWAVSKLAG